MDTQSQIDALAARIDAFNQSSTITRDQETALRERLGLNTSAVSINYTGLVKFGGTGADGALTISSGSTVIDLNNTTIFVMNYSSISITGTAALSFINPSSTGTVIVFKCTGDVTITSSANPTINLNDLGGAGGGAASANNGITGNSGTSTFVNTGGGILGNTLNPTGFGGVGGVAPLNGASFGNAYHSIPVACGSGGASGASSPGTLLGSGGGGGGASLVTSGAAALNGGAGGGAANGSSGAGGRGAGAILIECVGAFTCSSIVNAVGTDATLPTGTTGSNGGGGGGGGGMFVCLYGTLVSNTGTYNLSGGARTQGIHMGANQGDGGVGGAGVAVVLPYNS